MNYMISKTKDVVKHADRANALVPNDWSSTRDVIRDIAADLDLVKTKVGLLPLATTDGSGASSPDPSVKEH